MAKDGGRLALPSRMMAQLRGIGEATLWTNGEQSRNACIEHVEMMKFGKVAKLNIARCIPYQGAGYIVNITKTAQGFWKESKFSAM